MLIPSVWTRRTVSPFATNGIDGLFDEYSDTWVIPTEIVETPEELRFALEVPGLRPEDIELTVENGVLTVTGEKKLEQRENETKDNYVLAERRYGRYTRSFRLPTTVDVNRVEAGTENGVLTIRLPRAEAAKPRRIQVTVNGGAQDVSRN